MGKVRLIVLENFLFKVRFPFPLPFLLWEKDLPSLSSIPLPTPLKGSCINGHYQHYKTISQICGIHAPVVPCFYSIQNVKALWPQSQCRQIIKILKLMAYEASGKLHREEESWSIVILLGKMGMSLIYEDLQSRLPVLCRCCWATSQIVFYITWIILHVEELLFILFY